ncbi:MAG: DUF5627 domain-containing protein [Prolixibacteraceae bacterium]
MKKIILSSLIVLSLFTACHNQPWEFTDYNYTTVYFPYQSPVRTIVLGEDIYDNTLDNAHKCKIMATMGGVYENKLDRILDVVVDNSFCDSLKFESDSGNFVLPLPSNYYSLDQSMQIVIPSGEISGGIEVQLSEAFFNDPLAIANSYVIPLRITSVTNADSILSGSSNIPNPDPRVAEDWASAPKDYILFCVKYVNPWHGAYLRRGIDAGKGNNGNTSLDTTAIYHNQYVERDQVVNMNTLSMNEVSLSLKTRDKGDDSDIPFELFIKIDDAGKCMLSTPETAVYSVSGGGEFVNDGDMWGGEKQDVMHLNYEVDFGTSKHTFTDTLVLRDRQVKFETFTPVVY